MQNNHNKVSYLKKKLFITGGYLVIAAMLLCIVSFAQYRIILPEEGRTIPEAGQIRTNMVLQPSLASHSQAWVTNEWANNLQPGQRAKTYANLVNSTPGDAKDCHKMDLYIYQQDTMNSDVTVDFTLRVQSSGRIPLEFYIPQVKLVGDDNQPVYKNYVSVPILNLDPSSDYIEYMFVEEGKELNFANEERFSLPKDTADPVKMEIYIGWNNTGTALDSVSQELKTLTPQELTDMSYRKEVDLLCVNADILSYRTKGYTHLTLKPQANE